MNHKARTIENNHSYILVLATIAAITGLLFGFDTGVISGALQFISNTFHIVTTGLRQYSFLGLMSVKGETLQEFIVAAVPAGALIGSIVSSAFARRVGRRDSIITTAIIFIVGTLVAALAFEVNMLIIGRLLMGFAVGLSAMVAPMYLSEVSPPDIRGAVVFLYQMAVTVGILMAFIVNYLFHIHGGWRMMFGVGLIPSVLLFLGMFLLPRSPRWLLQQGQETRAEKVLRRLRGEIADIGNELADIKVSVKRARGSFKTLFSTRTRILVVITFGLFVFQQFTGINTILYYAPTIFKAAGFTGSSAQILALIATGAVNVLATLFGILLVDRLGRRNLLFIGMIGMIACLITMGCAYHGSFTVAEAKWITLVAALVFIVFFATSIGGIAYVMMSELFPLNLRSKGMAVASSANWGFNMIVTASFLTLVHSLGLDKTYWLYAGLSTIGLFFILLLVPETKNISLEHIEKNLYAGRKARHLGHPLLVLEQVEESN